MTHPLTVPAVGAVAVVSVALAGLAYRAYLRSGNPNLRYVLAAFCIFAAEGLLATASLQWGLVDHTDLELLLSVFDLSALLVLAFPFLLRR